MFIIFIIIDSKNNIINSLINYYGFQISKIKMIKKN